MGNCNCNEADLKMCNCLIYWTDILGNPSECKILADYIKEAVNTEISGDDQGELNIDLAELAKEVLELIETSEDGVVIDPYKIVYKDTTVGDALDELRYKALEGTISPDLNFEKGRKVRDLEIAWVFNKPVKSLKINIEQGGFPVIEKELDPTVTKYELPEIISDTIIRVTGTDEKDNEVILKSTINFKLVMYCGTSSGTKLGNKEILAFNTRLFDEKEHSWENLWNCQHGEYIYYLFPYEAPKFYNFYTNKMKDNSFKWEVIKVTNQYGYQYDYYKFRSDNLLTGIDILTEVTAHEVY